MNPYLVPCLNFGPLVVQRIIARLDPSHFDVALAQGRFTPREVVSHLADWEPILRGRIEQAVSNPGSVIAAFDESQMAIDHGYARLDVDEQVTLFVRERQITYDLVAGIPRDSLQNRVTHPERGELTGEDLVGMLIGHDMYHVEQLSAYLEKPPL